MGLESKKNNGVGQVCTNYVKEERFLKACEEAIRMSPGMEQSIREIKYRKTVSKNEVYWYIHKAQTGDNFAVEVLVNSYMPYALRKAVDYCKEFNAKYLFEDVYQEFLVCIQEVMLSYDLKLKSDVSVLLGTKFYRVAMDTIYGSGNSKYRLPTHVTESLTRVKRYMDQNCLSEDDKYDVIQYCKNTLGCSEEKAELIFMCLQDAVDIDNVEDICVVAENIEENIMNSTIKDVIVNSLKALKDREKTVIMRRYGLNDDDEATLEETGKIMEITRERVRQIENKALMKMRGYLNRTGFDYTEFCAA